jgi:hypothetical protein
MRVNYMALHITHVNLRIFTTEYWGCPGSRLLPEQPSQFHVFSSKNHEIAAFIPVSEKLSNFSDTSLELHGGIRLSYQNSVVLCGYILLNLAHGEVL